MKAYPAPWDEALAKLKEIYGAENDAHDPVALEALRGFFDQTYERGRLAGVVEEAARHRSTSSTVPLKA